MGQARNPEQFRLPHLSGGLIESVLVVLSPRLRGIKDMQRSRRCGAIWWNHRLFSPSRRSRFNSGPLSKHILASPTVAPPRKEQAEPRNREEATIVSGTTTDRQKKRTR
jgi:hypothetical protein